MPGAPLDECCEFLEVPHMDAINAWCFLDECLLILGGPQMDAINAWCSLNECCESWRSPDGCY